jgi:hypothetical protein
MMGNERWHDVEEEVHDVKPIRAKSDEPPDLVYA